ncbi:uridine kinase [Blastococcus xanthinilyticus]|uniref:Uridine kinase n=1 Tax=Blastococcus xanthinilyticus TaxID=1564164 RepID=A0A5S5CSJ7_9ACTN|nr:uridine kinase [Blastococcus xanthinilyticus]TYP84987.1 uridine kinase [Blastococcus xanthinilyticus]
MELVSRLAAAVAALTARHSRVLVGIDGPDAAGKTTLADRLAAELSGPVQRVSVDDFPRPVEERYRRGELSAEGFYLDAIDHDRLLAEVLVPFRNGADGAGPRTLVVDGIFLLRPQLRRLWHLSVHLRVPEQTVLARARQRDRSLYASLAELEQRYRARYLPGQALYRAEADPETGADVLIDNRDVSAPRILRWDAPDC